MPFLGEVPITTFFSRAESTSTKRKVTTNKSSNKRRRKEVIEVTSNAPSIDNPKGKKAVFGSSMITREEEESSTSPIVLGSRSRTKQAEIVSFLTPPPARNLHVTTRKTPPFDVDMQPRALKPNDGVAIQRRGFFLPTPTTMPRPHASQSHRNSVEPDPQEPILQPVHLPIHCTPSRNPHNPFSMSPGRSQPSTPKRRKVFPGPLQPTFFQKDDTTFEDFTSDRGIVIGSSQSQFLSPIHKSPQRPQINSERLRSATSLDEDSIPSSQIQERELTVSCVEPKSRFRQMGIAFPPSSVTNFSATSKTPARTLSDEMFSVPIQSTTLSHIFASDEGVAGYQPAPSTTASLETSEKFFSNSATESETDNEREGTNSYSQDRIFNPCHRYGTQPTPPSQSESFPASLGISSSSLPSIVQVFHDMPFGNDDESYPPDFPMSLRL